MTMNKFITADDRERIEEAHVVASQMIRAGIGRKAAAEYLTFVILDVQSRYYRAGGTWLRM